MKAVGKQAWRGSPKFATELQNLQKYVRAMRKQDGTLLYEMVAFNKTRSHPRVVTRQVLPAIAEGSLGEDGHGAIRFRPSPNQSHGQRQQQICESWHAVPCVRALCQELSGQKEIQ